MAEYEEEGVEETEEVPVISLHAMGGLQETKFSTMRLVGWYKKKKLHLLLDSGSTYNVLDQAVAKSLGCKITILAKPLVITVANGQEVVCNQCCK